MRRPAESGETVTTAAGPSAGDGRATGTAGVFMPRAGAKVAAGVAIGAMPGVAVGSGPQLARLVQMASSRLKHTKR